MQSLTWARMRAPYTGVGVTTRQASFLGNQAGIVGGAIVVSASTPLLRGRGLSRPAQSCGTRRMRVS
jgi:hypothetical protein